MKVRTYSRPRGKYVDSDDLPGYPEYSGDEDIYRNAIEEEEIDPENTKRKKERVYDEYEDELDVPGAEMDDEMEELGSEDEENNYYSLSDNDDLEDLI
jgi:hypothetical protein